MITVAYGYKLVAAATTLNSSPANNQTAPAVAGLANGDFQAVGSRWRGCAVRE